MVGATRIELATSRPPGVRATTALSPDIRIHKQKLGQGDETWTHDLAVPNRARYQLRHTLNTNILSQSSEEVKFV